MEAVEFYIVGNQTCIRRGGISKPLTEHDREEIEFMLENMRRVFPQAVERLEQWAANSKLNRPWFEYLVVDRFIRCNFGEADFLYSDVDDLGMFHLEEVRCPLRGICNDDGVICKPKAKLDLTDEEKRVVDLYARGLLPSEIAAKLGKAEATCKRQLYNACKRLKLPHPRWLIRFFSIYPVAQDMTI